MPTNRSLASITFRFAGWTALLGIAAIAACNRAPTPPEKMTIAPATPGTAAGFAVLRQEKDADRNQEASDNRFDIAAAYIFIDPDMPQYYDLVLLEKPLDNQKLGEATEPDDVVDEALRGGANGVMFSVDGDGDIGGSFRLVANGKTVQFGGSGTGKVRGLVREGDKVKGHVHYFGTVFVDHIAIDATFDAKLVAPPTGKPLPPDGGDAGAAYLETVAAMRDGDVDKLVALMPPERAKMIDAERAKPDFAQNIAMLKAMAPTEVQVTGGTSYGERVVLTTKGTEGKEPFTGTAEMNWEAGGWRMGSQSSRMGSSGNVSAEDAKGPQADEPPVPDDIPLQLTDGVVGKGFLHGESEFAPTEAFAVALPEADYGPGRMLVLMAADKLEPKNAKAMWDDDTPVSALFADGKGHPSIWLNLSRSENGQISQQKAMMVDAEGNFEEAWGIQLAAIETGGKLVGTVTQDMQVNETKYHGIARFTLPVAPAAP